MRLEDQLEATVTFSCLPKKEGCHPWSLCALQFDPIVQGRNTVPRLRLMRLLAREEGFENKFKTKSPSIFIMATNRVFENKQVFVQFEVVRVDEDVDHLF